jgi:integrase
MNTLRQAIHEYLALRRGLGFTLREAGNGLFDFASFMERHRASYITEELAVAWAQQSSNVQPARWAARLGYIRAFARHRSATDPRTQIPHQGLLPFQPKRARPYLYSHEEIQRLMRAALKMPYRYECGALRPWVYYCLFGLLSVSGLRLGEARNLELRDVDLQAGVLTIRGTKFGKSRLVPTACLDLRSSRGLHGQASAPLCRTDSILLFVSLQLGRSFGQRRCSSNILRFVPTDRHPWNIRQSRSTSARHAPLLCNKHTRAMVSSR